MNRSPFVATTNMLDHKFSFHHSAVLWVEQTEDGAIVGLRAGNHLEMYVLKTPFEEVMRELERARRAEIVSFGE